MGLSSRNVTHDSSLNSQKTLVADGFERIGYMERRGGGEWIRLGRAEPGCLVLFEKDAASHRYHVGIVMGDGLTFAHCPFGGASRIDRLDCALYANQRKTFYRYSKRK